MRKVASARFRYRCILCGVRSHQGCVCTTYVLKIAPAGSLCGGSGFDRRIGSHSLIQRKRQQNESPGQEQQTRGRPSEAQVPAGHGRATSLVERGIGGGFGSRLLLLQSGGFSAQGDRGPRSAPRTVPGLSPPAELALTAAGSIPERQAAAPRHWLRNRTFKAYL